MTVELILKLVFLCWFCCSFNLNFGYFFWVSLDIILGSSTSKTQYRQHPATDENSWQAHGRVWGTAEVEPQGKIIGAERKRKICCDVRVMTV